jgi:Ser/Thr protein kinase RdoA (MazF antagonist)
MDTNQTKYILEVASNFCIDETIQEVFEITTGHINRTYHLITGAPRSYILQKVNTVIFKDTAGLMNNISLVTKHLRARLISAGKNADREALQLIPTKQGETYLMLGDEAWRMYLTIENARTYDRATSNDMFCEVGRAFGSFQRELADFDASQLCETIPAFHDTVQRYAYFEEIVARDVVGRRAEVESEIAFFMERKKHAGFIVDGIREGRFPLRVTHNDTKLNNIMIDDETGKGICILDLDTVMPGSVLADFGDAIRFGASTAAEDETDLSLVYMDIDKFSAFAKGFVGGLEGSLTENEVRALPMGAYMMTLECGLRFLTDYLNGDTYFRIKHPTHNLDRARNQMKLVEDMEAKMSQMNEIIESYL